MRGSKRRMEGRTGGMIHYTSCAAATSHGGHTQGGAWHFVIPAACEVLVGHRAFSRVIGWERSREISGCLRVTHRFSTHIIVLHTACEGGNFQSKKKTHCTNIHNIQSAFQMEVINRRYTTYLPRYVMFHPARLHPHTHHEVLLEHSSPHEYSRCSESAYITYSGAQ